MEQGIVFVTQAGTNKKPDREAIGFFVCVVHLHSASACEIVLVLLRMISIEPANVE